MYNYPATWSSTLPRPSLRLEAKAWVYDLGMGEVPVILAKYPKVYGGNPFELKARAGVRLNLTGSPVGCVDGHHCVRDGGFTVLLETDDEVPVMPCFVKDLAGRVIYLGGSPTKLLADWEAHGGDKMTEEGDPLNPLIPLITFPRHCYDAAEMPGADLLETIFLTRFRTLDMSVRARSLPSGSAEDDDNIAISYQGANLYPYKYRLDTFYIDGYKLPQTTMLFARREGVRPDIAIQVGENMLERWDNRKQGQDYPAFLKAMGNNFAEEMYKQGCTLIPTFEAANGYHVVSDTFELEDYWPGCAVPGLHAVAESRDDKAPAGTILEVLRPGYVTATNIVPAAVVTSNGSGYVSPNVADPLPFVPNLYLPHQRTLANWQATWLPTHPRHFEAPALWGFDIISGHFMQLYGPLWDPLHYYYSCTDDIIAATKKPLSMEQNRWFIPVPESMENRFHPIVPLKGFDFLSVEALERKREQNRRPFTLVTRLRNGKETAGIGYHPLPMEFEYELDPFWFPVLHPLNREHDPLPPPELENRIAPIIRPKVSVNDYLQQVNAPDELYWLKNKEQLFAPTDDPLENYPHLLRYMAQDLPLDKVLPLIPMPFLADVDPDLLFKPTETYFAGQDTAEDLAEIDSGIFDAWWDARDEGHKWLKFRHLLYREAIELYALGWWYGASPLLLEDMLADWMASEDEVATRQTAAGNRLRGGEGS